MASAPQNLPLLYKDLVPLSSQEHGSYNARPAENWGIMKGIHAFPLTVEEFVTAGRVHPIVFTTDAESVPLALFGLNEGVNVFLDDANALVHEPYIPAYCRRYPFMLVQLREGTDELTLCFDPSTGLIGDFEEGQPLFENGQPAQPLQDLLKFCEDFQQAVAKTAAFMKELDELGLLMDGEITIEQPGETQPFIYRGFRIVDEAKLRDMRGDQLRKIMQNGMLPLIHAHLFSLQVVPMIFNRQYAAGQVPKQG